MSEAPVIQEVQARVTSTMAPKGNLTRELLRQPRGPQTAERGWKLVADIHLLIGFAAPEVIDEALGGPDSVPLLAALLQHTYDGFPKFISLAIRQGAATQPWFRALQEAVDKLADTLEALYLSADPEFQSIVKDAVKELAQSSASVEDNPLDWSASIAKMPD